MSVEEWLVSQLGLDGYKRDIEDMDLSTLMSTSDVGVTYILNNYFTE